MNSVVGRTLYIVAVAVLAAVFDLSDTGIGKDSIVWLVVVFLLATLFFFALVIFDVSGQRTGRPPSKPFMPYQHAMLSPNGLRWICYGFFGLGLGSACRNALAFAHSGLAMYTPFAYGCGAFLGLVVGEWIVYREEGT